ncbi:MAG: hypothetical protein WC688_07340 [Parachlamydiales bacterium]|jgi:hypothetical protein
MLSNLIIIIQIIALFIGIHMTPLVFIGVLKAKNISDFFKVVTIWAFFWTLFLTLHLKIF